MKNRTWNFRDEDTMFDMMRYWTNLDQVFEKLNEDQTRAYDMTVSSSQWLSEWKQAYEQKGRPVASYNLLRQVVNVINAIELSNRKKTIAKPKSGGDTQLAEVVTQVMHHFFYRTKYDWHRTKVFNNSVIAKYGVYSLGWNYENDDLGELEIDDIDPRTIRFEPNYADPTWQKAGYIMRKHSLSFEEIINKFALNDMELQNAIIEEASIFYDREPDKRDRYLSKKLKQLFSAVYEVATGNSSSYGAMANKYLNWFDPLTLKFDVLELHEKRTERRLVVGDSKRNKEFDITDMVKEKDDFRFNNELIGQVKERYGFDGEPRTQLMTKKFVTAVVPAFRLKVNEQPYPYNMRGFVYIPQYCYDYHADPFKAQSVIDDLIDPQSTYNKAQSLKLELLWRYANNGWVMDANAIDGYEEDWESGRMAPFRRVRPGYMGQIKPEQHQVISADLIRETQELPVVMDRIANTSETIRGKQEKGVTSGKHFIAVRNQEEKSFSYMFSNVDNSAIAVAESAWNIIQWGCPVERIFRITTDEGQEQQLVVNQKQYGLDPETGQLIQKVKNDITIGEYDFEMDKTPYSSNAREIEFQKLAELFDAVVSVNPEKADAILPILVKAGDFPHAAEILEIWKNKEGGSPEQQQMQQLMMQVQQIMIKLGIAEKQEDVKGKALDNMKKQMELKQMAMDNILGMRKGTNGKQKKKPEYSMN